MDFELTEEQQMIQDAARDFAQEQIAPVAAAHDESGEFPLATIRQAGELGFMGIEVPEAYGGAGMDPVSFVLMMEEIAAADAAHSTVISVNNSLYCNGILEFGTEDQKRRFVTPVASGEAIGAYALTEPQSGSDASNMRTRAELSDDGSHYVITGKKSWITSGPVAKYMILFAVTAPDAGAKGVTAFLVDAEQEGLIRGKVEPKLGIRASATCEIELDGYRCPVENRLGDEGQGFRIAMTVLEAGRIGIAAQAVGIARAAYEASVEYAKERKAFGAPIGSFQMIQSKLADMRMRLDAARLLTWRAAWMMDRGMKNNLEASMCKSKAGLAVTKVTQKAVEILGPLGYSRKLLVEKWMRDAKINDIFEGTGQINTLIVAREILGYTRKELK